MIRDHISQPFIIIGMHRSGTSLLADTLNNAGIFMGAIRDHNGEAMHFLSLNQQMLWAENADWINPKVPSESNNKTLPPNIIYAEHIKSLSSNPTRLRWLHNKPWGWKDPRNTFTLVHWLKVFPKARVIHVVRDGRDVALSLKSRNSIKGEVFSEQLNNIGFNFTLWEKYVQKGQEHQEELGSNCLTIKYERLVGLEDSTLKELEKFTGKELKSFLKVKKLAKKQYPPELNELAANSDVFKKMGYHV